MTQIQMKGQTTVEHLPRLFRNRTVDYTLMILGAIVAAFGAYTYFAPSSWVVAGLSAAWYLSFFIAGGVLLAVGLGMLGASMRDRSGRWTASAITSFVLSALALAGAVVAAVFLIF
jgi:predicted MFS family arabinose efflux permease